MFAIYVSSARIHIDILRKSVGELEKSPGQSLGVTPPLDPTCAAHPISGWRVRLRRGLAALLAGRLRALRSRRPPLELRCAVWGMAGIDADLDAGALILQPLQPLCLCGVWSQVEKSTT